MLLTLKKSKKMQLLFFEESNNFIFDQIYKNTINIYTIK